MTDNKGIEGDHKSEDEQDNPDNVLRGLFSDNCQTDKEGNLDTTHEPGEQRDEGAENQEQHDYEEQLIKEKLSDTDITFVLETLKKKAPYDGIPIKQLFYGMCSAFTKSPIPHNVNSKDAGAGKSYLLSHVAGYFPNRYVLPLTGMSDKAIFHRPGVMVIERYDEQKGELEVVPITPIISELELQLEEIGEQTKTEKNKKEYRQKIKEIEAEIKDINERAEKLIDLNNQIILGLDTPQDSLLETLMTLMSQDFPGDQKYEFAEKHSSGKMGRRINRLHGMPVLFTSRVIDDTRALRFSERNRRFINVNPVTSSKKISAANDLIALTYGSLPEEYDQLVVSRSDSEKCRPIIKIIVAKLKQHSNHLEPKQSGIIVPFHKAMSQSIPVSEDQPWSMTVTERTAKYLSIITKVNMDNRPRIVDTRTGQFWPVATFDDLKETLRLMERAASGVRPYIVNWFNDVLIPAFKDLDGKPNELRNANGALMIKERYVGVTTEQLAEKTKEIYGGLKPSTGDLLTKYLYPLINQGIVDKVLSDIDHRSRLLYPVEATAGGSNIFALFIDPDDIRLKAPNPDAYPSKNTLEDSIRFTLDCCYKEGVGNGREYKIIDIDGKEITSSELAERYFGSPGDCFIKADETLSAEERGASSNNYLYSQITRYKITPPTCNNILSELRNNRIEDDKYPSKIESQRRIEDVQKNAFDVPQYKKFSNESKMEKSAISDTIIDNKNIEKRRLTLRHSSAAHVITNNDLEDIEDRNIEKNSSSCSSRGESV